MAVTFVIRFNVVPAERERFLALLGGVHADPDNEHRFMLYETWEDLEDVVEVQLKRPYREAWHAALPEILAEERDISIWRPLRADHRAKGRRVRAG